ncbi:MAG: HPF/RaiA family ribosome-associated protein [Acidobacteria bacterium]|nr:HPF/RaiA family ribosome-associated protein [Acidobacteriota bacterium]MBS1864510.1 HPF/RaiA family ribosome-associated protein [Acidobacteriota bacterium]
MKFDVRIESEDLKGALKTYIRRRLHFTLGRFGAKLGRVRVRVEDIPGAGDSLDTSCRIQAELLPAGRILRQEAVDRNLYIAVDLATERIGRSFERSLVSARAVSSAPRETSIGSYSRKEALP